MKPYISGLLGVLVGVTAVVWGSSYISGAGHAPDDITVLNCTGPGPCQEDTLSRVLVPGSCRNRYDDPVCDYQPIADENVSLITDVANYVRLPFPVRNRSYTVQDLGETNAWDLEFLPDSTYLTTHRGGTVLYHDGNGPNLVSRLNVAQRNEAGLMGLAIHPAFNRTGYIYLMFSRKNKSAGGLTSTIARYVFRNNSLHRKTVLLSGIPASQHHAGGRLDFGPDGKLYATIGDALQKRRSQNPSLLNGKIIRLNPNGTIPADNPFDNSPVYSLGHRNPQGLAWRPATGTLYSTEHGPWRYDEINRVIPGENYGHPYWRCNELNTPSPLAPSKEEVNFPLFCPKKWTLAPSGATFVNDPGHPWHGDLFVGGLRGQQVLRIDFSPVARPRPEVFFVARHGEMKRRIRDIEYHNGSLWALSDDSKIAVIRPDRPENFYMGFEQSGTRKIRGWKQDLPIFIVHINDKGLREEPFPRNPRPNTLRILVLGDSQTFGWGVNESSRFTNIVERKLNRSLKRRVEVLNAGIPGWGMKDYYRFLRWRGLSYQPDIVVVAMSAQDPLDRGTVMDMYNATNATVFGQVGVKFLNGGKTGVIQKVKKKMSRYYARHDFESSGMLRQMSNIVAATRESRATPLFFSISSFTQKQRQQLIDWQKKHNVTITWAPKRFQTHEKTVYTIPKDSHYNELGHKWLADKLYTRLSAMIERK